MFGISDYITAGAVSAALAAGGYGFLQKQNADISAGKLEAAETLVRVRDGELATCGARLQNILDDVRDDNAIDELTDDDLRHVPDHWLYPPTATITASD